MVYITYSYILYILYHLDLFYLEKKQLCSHAPSYSMVYTTVFTVRLNDYPLSLFPSLFTSNWFSKLQCLDHCTAKDLAVDFSLSLSSGVLLALLFQTDVPYSLSLSYGCFYIPFHMIPKSQELKTNIKRGQNGTSRKKRDGHLMKHLFSCVLILLDWWWFERIKKNVSTQDGFLSQS